MVSSDFLAKWWYRGIRLFVSEKCRCARKRTLRLFKSYLHIVRTCSAHVSIIRASDFSVQKVLGCTNRFYQAVFAQSSLGTRLVWGVPDLLGDDVIQRQMLSPGSLQGWGSSGKRAGAGMERWWREMDHSV